MRQKTRRKFLGVSNHLLDLSHSGEHIESIEELVKKFKEITGKEPEPDTYPCPYYIICGEICMMMKAYHCDEYKRRERLRRMKGDNYGQNV